MKFTIYKNRQALLNAEVVADMQSAQPDIWDTAVDNTFFATADFNSKTRVLTLLIQSAVGRAPRGTMRLYVQRTNAGKIYNLTFFPTRYFRQIGVDVERLNGETLELKTTRTWEYTVQLPELEGTSKQAVTRRRVRDILNKLTVIDRNFLRLYLKPEVQYK